MSQKKKEIDPVLGIAVHREHIKSEKQLMQAIQNEKTAYHLRVFTFESETLREKHRQLTADRCHLR